MTSLSNLLTINQARFGNNYENFLTPKGGFPILNSKNVWVLAKSHTPNNKGLYLNFLAEKIVEDGSNIAKLSNIEALIKQFNSNWMETRKENSILYKHTVEEIRFNSKTPGYSWLSNFFQTLIYSKEPIPGIFSGVESAYKAYKDFLAHGNKESFLKIAKMTDVTKLKKLKADVPKNITIPLMSQLIHCKFEQNLILKERLKATTTLPLIEHTNNIFWGDGSVHETEKGSGENKLGQILMEERIFTT